MGILSSLTDFCFGKRRYDDVPTAVAPGNRSKTSAARRGRRCQLEALEPRQLLAADGLAPEVVLGSVYFEEASLNDSAPDVIEVSFVGGAPGTTLNRLVIDGDKEGNGLSAGDVVFDTAPGGLGVFGNSPFSIVSAEGFSVDSVSVVDGGSQIVFTFTGFQAGMKLVFSIDADEVQFVESGAIQNGQVDPSKVDINSVVEGAEFQRSIMTGDFSAPGYVDLTLTGLYWDFFDSRFDEAQSAAGLIPDLPTDVYSQSEDLSVWTAGAVAHEPQIPLATLSGWVYHDRNDDGNFDRDSEHGIGGVTLELLDAGGNPTGVTTVTSADPDSLGFYIFVDLFPGTYGVRETQPDGWLDGKDTPGSHGGTAADETSGPVDVIFGAVLTYGDHGIEYNFGELLPGSIAGRVHAHTGPDCDFDNPELLLEGVRIDLLDGAGNVLEFTFTDANGEYEFTNLVPGTYQVREHQPVDYYDGEERVGTAGGTSFDIGEEFSVIAGINLGSGVDAFNYDFCEHIGVMLSGNVYHDRNDDGIFDRDTEEGIGDVVVKLLEVDDGGQLVDTGLRATTDGAGFYKFNNLRAGKYAVMEIHPEGWLDGKDTAGNLGGVVDTSPGGDMISMIMIQWGEMGIEYNFGELLPGSIRGIVVVSTDPDCDPHDGEPGIEGVRIDLLNANGQIVATTFTDADGAYEFTDLPPGTYTVLEHQPDGYFDLDAHVGSGGGTRVHASLITDIYIGSDQHLIDYDFCEEPPGEISGFVFIDGEPIVTNDPLTPEQIGELRDGQRTPDDTPLAGVTMRLVDSASGLPIHGDSDLALPGQYPSGPITVATDASGFYLFSGLRAGTYAVVQNHPEDLVDGIDTAGQHDGEVLPNSLNHGFAVNPAPAGAGDQLPNQVALTIELFRQQYGNDAIVLIPLPAGQHSRENNFSEVQVRPEPPLVPPPEYPPPPVPPQVFPPPLSFAPPQLFVPPPLPVNVPEYFGGSAKALGYTWHLSVVNAGAPRSMRVAESAYQFVSAIDVGAWQSLPMDAGRWTLAKAEGDHVIILREEIFGHPDAIPVTGDFNGDGLWNIGVYVKGRWFLDLNGNGFWDEGDLLARLGSEDDHPVTGDWDDDGKTDIGIFGPVWPRDPWAIAHEPGLPDPDNHPTHPADKPKNMPPVPEEATSGGRVMKRTAQGKPRTDLIDHVFHFGTPGDIPITGDWNGTGIRAIGVFRDGQWHLDLDGDGRFTDADATFEFGQPGDLPVVGDFNGDGIDEIGIYRDGRWILDTNGNRQIDAYDQVFELGGPGDLPVVGDWDGDGIDDPGVYQPGVVTDRVSRRAG